MAINLDVQDLVNYPGTVKRVTIDTEVVVPAGFEGDERYIISASTSAYADNVTRSAISDVYDSVGNVGWTKSSGFKGTNGKFALDSTHCEMAVRMDAASVGTPGIDNGYYKITLDHSNGLYLKGEDIATDIQNKLHAVTCSGLDAGFQLAYKNCTVKFNDNKFYIASGSISDTFTGSARSSVSVTASTTNSCVEMLGFDQQITSEELAYVNVVEAPLISDYTAGSTSMVVGLLSGVSPKDALCITDGTNIEYFIAENAVGGTFTVSSSAITNSYAVADGAYVQLLRKVDPDLRVNSYHKDTDELLRYMAKIIINQIDFSS